MAVPIRPAWLCKAWRSEEDSLSSLGRGDPTAVLGPPPVSGQERARHEAGPLGIARAHPLSIVAISLGRVDGLGSYQRGVEHRVDIASSRALNFALVS